MEPECKVCDNDNLHCNFCGKDNMFRAEHVSECWGWINSKENTLQGETFSSSTAALAEMCRRLSLDIGDPGAMDQIYMLGFKLATVGKKLSVRRILD